MANAYYSDHADSLTYDKAQLESYYDEHKDELDSFTYSAAFINGEAVSSTDADGNTVDPTDAEKATAMSVAKATAEDLAQQAEAGGDFDALAGGVCRSGRQVLLQGGDDRPRLRLDPARSMPTVPLGSPTPPARAGTSPPSRLPIAATGW